MKQVNIKTTQTTERTLTYDQLLEIIQQLTTDLGYYNDLLDQLEDHTDESKPMIISEAK